MAKIKLTKSAVDAAKPQAQAVELRDTVVPGFLCKITPAGRKVFMLQYRTNAGERRKPALGQYGELTVEQARVMAQEWLAEVRRGGDPSAAKNAARKAPTMKEYCHTFMEDYSKQRNKPSTQRGYPREVVKEALRLNAAAVILSHNHPSGHPEPSQADRVLTQQLKDALALVDVRVLDHIIVAGTSTASLAESGLI